MPKDKIKDDYALVVDQLTANTKELLSENYARAHSFRDENNVIKIAISHRVLANEFGELETISEIGFGKKIKMKVEHTVDTTGQLDFEPKPPAKVKKEESATMPTNEAA